MDDNNPRTKAYVAGKGHKKNRKHLKLKAPAETLDEVSFVRLIMELYKRNNRGVVFYIFERLRKGATQKTR